jgi:CBS domain-containing protein
MKVKEIMRPVRVISEDATVRDAAKLMHQHRIGSLVVTADNAKGVAGIITERDILGKVTAENKSPAKVKVNEIMTKKVITVTPDAFIDDAIYLMIEHKIKKLPVVENRELIGIITSTDIVNNSLEVGQFYVFD